MFTFTKINSAPIQSCDPKQGIMGSGVMRASAPHFSLISIKKYSVNKRRGVRRGAESVHHVEQLRVGSVQLTAAYGAAGEQPVWST